MRRRRRQGGEGKVGELGSSREIRGRGNGGEKKVDLVRELGMGRNGGGGGEGLRGVVVELC